MPYKIKYPDNKNAQMFHQVFIHKYTTTSQLTETQTLYI